MVAKDDFERLISKVVVDYFEDELSIFLVTRETLVADIYNNKNPYYLYGSSTDQQAFHKVSPESVLVDLKFIPVASATHKAINKMLAEYKNFVDQQRKEQIQRIEAIWIKELIISDTPNRLALEISSKYAEDVLVALERKKGKR